MSMGSSRLVPCQSAQHAGRDALDGCTGLGVWGSENIDYRLRNAEFTADTIRCWLVCPLRLCRKLQTCWWIGSDLQDHPLFAQRIRQVVRHGAVVSRLVNVDS